ncbi:transposase, IS4 family [Oesophagostomum dentatum]|uniref:Transposase, IS4 family n=1 Tax=Oesophagostomum dentatum TaxID=61180 RepID=A0A0B1TMB5_OESDE|nr:transposase, IS4 family [Oesophagostomum dentatum]
MLSPLLSEKGLSSWEISKEDQVLITLRYLATNSFQTAVGDGHGVSQEAVSDIVERVIEELNHPTIEERFLRFWPSDAQWCWRRSREFARRSRFTNVVGCVDGCLIPIQKPDHFGNQYYCRKACGAVKMVAVVDARARFLYINCGFAGRHHDSFIWRYSQASEEFEQGRAQPGYRLLGDAGFANSKSVMAPYRESSARVDRRKRNFNKEHAKARRVVEQAFSALKRRFSILHSTARLEPPKLQKAIKACVLLYNIGIYLGAHRGQSLSPLYRGNMTHPPDNDHVREFVAANL